MEPPDGETNYTERLVRLPNLSVAYPRPPAHLGTPPAPVTKLKADGQTVYLCAQSLFKLLPEHDDVFPAIARAGPDAAFLFIAHRDTDRHSVGEGRSGSVRVDLGGRRNKKK